MATDTEALLIKKAKDGDNKAILELWLLWKRLIYLKCRKYLKTDSNIYDMDDIMQTAFIGFLKGIECYELEKGAFISYDLYYIYNAVRRDLLRIGLKENPLDKSASLNKPLPSDENIELMDVIEDTAIKDMDEALIWRNTYDIVMKAVNKLEPQERRVILLFYGKGLTAHQTSQVTGIKETKIRNIAIKAREKLRRSKRVRLLYEDLFPTHSLYSWNVEIAAIRSMERDRFIDSNLSMLLRGSSKS